MSSPTRHILEGEWHTPQKARVKALKNDAHWSFRQIEQRIGLPKSTIFDLYHDRTSRRPSSGPHKIAKRGRPSILSPTDIHTMEQILESHEFESRALTWEQLGYEAGLDVAGRTIQRAMGTMDYHKCIACRKGWVNNRTKQRRLEWATLMLDRYPQPSDWKNIRFSDKCHFGWGQQGKLRIIRKPGERYCQDCIQEADPRGDPNQKDEKRLHTWAAIGWDFKSDMVFYEVPGNRNGKMSHQVYRNSILEPVVKPWIDASQRGRVDPFVLEEDGDSGHGGGSKRNIVRQWKDANGLKTYFNCSHSPDLAPIENCWQPSKQLLRKVPHWDDEITKELILEGWDNVSIPFINKKVESMPARLQAVIDGQGAMTGF